MDSLGFTALEELSYTVVFVPSAGGEAKLFMKLPFRALEASCITPDGHLIAVVGQKHSDVWLMENVDPDVEPSSRF